MKKRVPLLLTLALTLLVGCSGGGGGKETNAGTKPLPETDPPRVSLPFLDEAGKSLYTVVTAEYAGDSVKKAASNVSSALGKTLGTDVESGTDKFERAAFEDLSKRYEILIGATNREESDRVAKLLTPPSFCVAVEGRKIVLIGTSEALTLRAANYFVSNVLPDLPQVCEGYFHSEAIRDPSSKTLPDKSKNVVNPRIVKTVYPTEDVVVADIIPTEDGYAVSGDGTADCTAGIQKALDTCYANGGGTVFLPAGVYPICGQLRIPEFVTLRGDWQDPDTGTDYGTVLEIWSAPKDDKLSGSVMLGGSGGVFGLTFYYPNQTIENVQPYPFTLYADGLGNRYMLQTVHNVTVLNGYRGIGACVSGGNAHEQLTVDTFKGTLLYTGAEVYNQADVGTWQNVTVSAKYWKEIGGDRSKPAADALDSYMKSKTIGLILGDLEWTEFHNLQVTGCRIGINVVKGKRIEFAGSLYDIAVKDCKVGVQVDSLDTRWGMLIARSTVEGGITNRTNGTVKLCDVKLTGKKTGTVQVTTGDLTAYAVRSDAACPKPAEKLYVAKLSSYNKNKDSAAELQPILDEAGKTGGIVYIPGGVYRFNTPLIVPSGVELRGTSAVATRDQGGDYNGTVLLSFYKGGVNDQAFITLGENAGIRGIRIYYPENNPKNGDYRTAYAVRGTGKNVYMVYSDIAGAGYGVDFRGCDNHFIKKVTTCCYYTTFLLGGKDGTLVGCLQNGTVLTRCSLPARKNPLGEGELFDVLFNPILRRQNYYIRTEGAQGEHILNSFAYGSLIFLTCRDSKDVLAVNIGCDNIGGAQTQMESGSLALINTMRYNGVSFKHQGGTLRLFNRLTINDKSEATYNQTK